MTVMTAVEPDLDMWRVLARLLREREADTRRLAISPRSISSC